MVVKEAGPAAKPGIYRLAIADGSWSQVTGLDGLVLSPEGFDNFPSLTPDRQPAMMSDTSVVQIYLAKWNNGSESH